VLRGLTVTTTFSEPQSGEYVSTELVLNATSGMAVTSAAANGGVIPAQDLNLVNSTKHWSIRSCTKVKRSRSSYLHKPLGRLLLRGFRFIPAEFKGSRHSTPAIASRLDKTIFLATAGRITSQFNFVCSNVAEAGSIREEIEQLDGVSHTEMGIIREYILASEWLDEELEDMLKRPH
jgi:hypothetical protein